MVDHDDLVEKIINNSNKKPLMGVVGPSPLQDLIGFHPIISLPRDLMHDFIEGICPMVIMSLLKQASSLRLLTYSENDFCLLTLLCLIILYKISTDFFDTKSKLI
jgi:hypothetical protein